MWAGKKAAGKKNKFEMEKGLVFNKSFDLVLSLKNFNFCNLAGSIAYNEPRIGDSGGLESLNFQSCTNLSNSLLLFSKFMKKGNIKGCCDKIRRNFQFLP